MQADMRGHPSPQRLTWSNFKVVANVVAALLVVHMLAVVILSAQSTAAGGGLVLFPLGVLLKGSSSNTTQVALPASSHPPSFCHPIHACNHAQYILDTTRIFIAGKIDPLQFGFDRWIIKSVFLAELHWEPGESVARSKGIA